MHRPPTAPTWASCCSAFCGAMASWTCGPMVRGGELPSGMLVGQGGGGWLLVGGGAAGRGQFAFAGHQLRRQLERPPPLPPPAYTHGHTRPAHAGVSVTRGGIIEKAGLVRGPDAYQYRLFTEDPLTGAGSQGEPAGPPGTPLGAQRLTMPPTQHCPCMHAHRGPGWEPRGAPPQHHCQVAPAAARHPLLCPLPAALPQLLLPCPPPTLPCPVCVCRARRLQAATCPPARTASPTCRRRSAPRRRASRRRWDLGRAPSPAAAATSRCCPPPLTLTPQSGGRARRTTSQTARMRRRGRRRRRVGRGGAAARAAAGSASAGDGTDAEPPASHGML